MLSLVQTVMKYVMVALSVFFSFVFSVFVCFLYFLSFAVSN